MELHRAQLFSGAFQVALVVKNPAANAGDLGDVGSIPGWDDPLEEGMATHSSILAWRDAMDRGESPWGHRESHANIEKRQEAEGSGPFLAIIIFNFPSPPTGALSVPVVNCKKSLFCSSVNE